MRGVIPSIIVLSLLAAAAAAEPPLATVGSHSISRAELENHVRPKLVELENQRYEAMRDGLDELIAAELFQQEAKARGITPEALEQQEISAKVKQPTDEDIQKVYDENKEELENAALDSVKPRIVEYMTQQSTAERHAAFLGELKKKYKTTVSLMPPVRKVTTAGRPERGGGPKAPVTMIEFSDYECPFCKRVEGTVEQVLTTYGNNVQLVYRDFPLPIHANARLASEAANCANAQGKFWDYHAKLLASDDLAKEKLEGLASEVGLDRAKFDDCLAKQQFKAAIDRDIADGVSVGVTGTPTIFINGRMLSGAQPFEKFKEVIDEELARTKKAKS